MIIKSVEDNLNFSYMMIFYLRTHFGLFIKKSRECYKNRSKHKKRGGEVALRYL